MFSEFSFTVPGALAQLRWRLQCHERRVDCSGTSETDAPQFTKVMGGGVKSIILKPFDVILKENPRAQRFPST